MNLKLFGRLLQSLFLAGLLVLALPPLDAKKKDNPGNSGNTPPGQDKKGDDSGDDSSGGDTSGGDSSSGGDTSTGDDSSSSDDSSGGDSSSGAGDDSSTDSSDKTTGKDKKNDDSGEDSSGQSSNDKGSKSGTVVIGSLDPDNPTVYHFSSDFTLKSDVVITGHAKIVADGGFDFKNSEVQLGPNSSLSMYVKGDVTLRGNGDINTLATPASFMIYGTGGQGQSIGVAGNAGISAVVYAPDADFSIKGTSGIFGAVIANSITNNGQGSSNKSFNGLNYDEALEDMSIGDDTITMEDYGIVNQNDHLGGDPNNSTYEDFFSQF